MDKERAINLVQKVLAKTGNNSNQHEVEVAMLKAQELLVKFGLTMDDVTDIQEKKKEVVNESVTEEGKSVWWIDQLSVIVSDNFRCKAVKNKFNRKAYLSFIGLKEDVQVAKEVFNFAIENIVYNSTRFVNEFVYKYNTKYNECMTAKDFNDFKNDYIKGFIHGVKEKFKEQVKQNNWGLVLVKDKDVVEFIDKMNLKKGRASNFKSANSSEAYDKGFKDGYSMDGEKKKMIK